MKSGGKKLFWLAALIFSAVFALGLWLTPAFARAEGECVIKEARFRPSGIMNSWYSDDYRPPVRVDIHSENCVDKTIEVSITDSDDHDSIDDPSTRDDVKGMDNENILVPGDYFSIKLVAGEDECELSDDPDCNYYVKIHKSNGGASQGYVSWGKERGTLRYDCTGVAWLFGSACDELWSFSGTELLNEDQWITLLNDPNLGGPISGYVLLAPLPGLESMDTTKTEGGGGLADYLNKIFVVVIGAAGVLAVLMLVINGIQYMMTDSVFQKSEAKTGIGNALLGLFLALGAVVILTTINPDLINLDLRVKKVTIGISPGEDIVFGGGVPSGESIELINKDGSKILLNACDESQMKTVSVFGSSVRVYKGLEPSLQRINTEWLQKPENERYKVNTIGGYNCRTVKTTGGQDTGIYSGHAFGLAIDINEKTNPYKKTLQTDMSPKFTWFINLFKGENWGWGGDWEGSKDPMHYSKLPPKFKERGDGRVEI